MRRHRPFTNVQLVSNLLVRLPQSHQSGNFEFALCQDVSKVLSRFRRRVWLEATEATGLREVHFHDLRHTGNMLTAEAGATLRELMDRMGHSSTRAALVYLHATSQRQRTIADAVGTIARAALREIDEHPSQRRTWHGSGTRS